MTNIVLIGLIKRDPFKIPVFAIPFFLVLATLIYAINSSADEDVSPCKDEMVEVLEAIKNRTQELDMREERIRIEEERLKSLKLEIENRITGLSKEREKIEKALEAIKTENKQDMERLAKVYENMPPEEAALRLEKLNKDLAVKLLKTMKERTAGKIMAFVAPDKAAELTQELGARLQNALKSPSQP